MEITGLIFLFAFLPFGLLLYHMGGRSLQPTILLCLSFAFYSANSLDYLVLLVVVMLLTYGVGQFVYDGTRGGRRGIFVAGLAVNLVPLIYYKYVGNILPLGISFFTFKSIAYLTDIYRGKIKEKPAFTSSLVYFCFFGQIVSGPLADYEDFSGLGKRRLPDGELFAEGVFRILKGLGKKVILADMLSRCTAESFGRGADELSTALAWLGAISFALELFFDFSGYSDIAIGITNTFGIRCRENFDYPYISRSVSEFWRRWHISLGRWFREYVYIPLGGSRTDKQWKIYRNLLVVWLLTGIWHGSGVNYLVWGLLNFGMIALERALRIQERVKRRWQKVTYRGIVLLFFVIQWVVFRAGSMGHAFAYLRCMFVPKGGVLADCRAAFLLQEYGTIFVVALILCVPWRRYIHEYLSGRSWRRAERVLSVAELVMSVVAGVFAVSFVLAGANNPFTYGNF